MSSPAATQLPPRIPAAVAAVVAEVLPGSHATLNALFQRAGAPGLPPPGGHASKWKEWLLRANDDPAVDSLKVMGLVLEEFMDLPKRGEPAEVDRWQANRQRVVDILEEYGLRYFRG